MLNYKSTVTILMLFGVWFSGCSNNNTAIDENAEHITALLADRNLSLSRLHSVYNSSDSTSNILGIELMHVNGQDLYKDEIAFALKTVCPSNCENYAYRMYIDSDHNAQTGYAIGGIGSDIRIGSDGYYRWSYNAWIPDIQVYNYEYILDTTGSEQLVIVAHMGTNNLFRTTTDIVMTGGSNTLESLQSPVISVTGF